MPQLHFNENAAPAVTELDDGTKVYRTCAAGFGCHNLGCGLKAYVKDGTRSPDQPGPPVRALPDGQGVPLP